MSKKRTRTPKQLIEDARIALEALSFLYQNGRFGESELANEEAKRLQGISYSLFNATRIDRPSPALQTVRQANRI